MSKKAGSNTGRRSRTRARQLEALRATEKADLQTQIRGLLAKPANQRTHFLRARVRIGGTAL